MYACISMNIIFVLDGLYKTSLIHKPSFAQQSKRNFKQIYMKTCDRNCDDLKQYIFYSYGYSEKTSKFSNDNTHFFLAQIHHCIENYKWHRNDTYDTRMTRMIRNDIYNLNCLCETLFRKDYCRKKQ